jgi:DNA repair exonuclease SbcCD ATPase subunit
MREINERLAFLRTGIREREKLNVDLTKAVGQKNIIEESKRNLYEQLKKEKSDVEKLERISPGNFLHTILGKKEEKLEKEKEELISAKISYDSATAELESLIREIERIKVRISDIGDVNGEYARLIKEKENILMEKYGGIRDKLNTIAEKESRLISDSKEISEAIQAGTELASSLDRVQESLRSAGNWGTWDIFGGGMIATMAKHSKIDDAQNEINNVQLLLKEFHRELKDMGGEIDLSIEIGSFLTFADYLFDGLFVDLAVQSKIGDAQEKAEKAKYKVGIVLENLKVKLNENHEELKGLRNQRMKIIEEA